MLFLIKNPDGDEFYTIEKSEEKHLPPVDLDVRPNENLGFNKKGYQVFQKVGGFTNHLADVDARDPKEIRLLIRTHGAAGIKAINYKIPAQAMAYYLSTGGKQPARTKIRDVGIKPISKSTREIELEKARLMGQIRLKKLTDSEKKQIGQYIIKDMAGITKPMKNEWLDIWYQEWTDQYEKWYYNYIDKRKKNPSSFFMLNQLILSDPEYFSSLVRRTGHEDIWGKAATLALKKK